MNIMNIMKNHDWIHETNESNTWNKEMKANEPFLGRMNWHNLNLLTSHLSHLVSSGFSIFDPFFTFNIIQYWFVLVGGFLSCFAPFEFLWPSSGRCTTEFLTCWILAHLHVFVSTTERQLSFLPPPWAMATAQNHCNDSRWLPNATPTYFVFFSLGWREGAGQVLGHLQPRPL